MSYCWVNVSFSLSHPLLSFKIFTKQNFAKQIHKRTANFLCFEFWILVALPVSRIPDIYMKFCISWLGTVSPLSFNQRKWNNTQIFIKCIKITNRNWWSFRVLWRQVKMRPFTEELFHHWSLDVHDSESRYVHGSVLHDFGFPSIIHNLQHKYCWSFTNWGKSANSENFAIIVSLTYHWWWNSTFEGSNRNQVNFM